MNNGELRAENKIHELGGYPMRRAHASGLLVKNDDW